MTKIDTPSFEEMTGLRPEDLLPPEHYIEPTLCLLKDYDRQLPASGDLVCIPCEDYATLCLRLSWECVEGTAHVVLYEPTGATWCGQLSLDDPSRWKPLDAALIKMETRHSLWDASSPANDVTLTLDVTQLECVGCRLLFSPPDAQATARMWYALWSLTKEARHEQP